MQEIHDIQLQTETERSFLVKSVIIVYFPIRGYLFSSLPNSHTHHCDNGDFNVQ